MNFNSRTFRGALLAVTVALAVSAVPAAGGTAEAGKGPRRARSSRRSSDPWLISRDRGRAASAGAPRSVLSRDRLGRVCRVCAVHSIPTAPAIEGATHLHSGKVRDLYRLDDGHLLMVASDRISAFDFVLDTTIPDKGEILTRMSLWWFAQLADLVPHHVLSTDVPEQVKGRAVVCEELAMYPVECVARGYLTGSGLLDYQARGEVCGIPLPRGLVDGSRLPEPMFTPATKAALGDHDENVSFEAVVGDVGADVAGQLRDLTLAVYARAERHRPRARHHPGRHQVRVRRAQVSTTRRAEACGPGSCWPTRCSRPTPAATGRPTSGSPGGPQASYDKQIVRNWLTSPASGWDRASGERPPPLPDEVVERTRSRYVEAFELLTGERF